MRGFSVFVANTCELRLLRLALVAPRFLGGRGADAESADPASLALSRLTQLLKLSRFIP